MGMNDLDTTRRYTKYKRHVNDSSERIDANDINQIQQSINEHQKDTNVIKDTAFQERVYTIFENNLYANAMFLDAYENGEYIDKTKSNNYLLNANLNNISIDKNSTSGIVTSTVIHSVHGLEIETNDFFLITNEYIPVGASIKYYIRLLSGERYPITSNALKTPLHLSKNINGFNVVIELTKNSLGESPIVNGYALLYWDAEVEKNYGMINPDLQRFPETTVGDSDGVIKIIRDRANEDKVVKILEPSGETTLVYNPDNQNRLAFVKTVSTVDETELSQIIKLYYEDYLNSKGKIDNVFTGLEQRSLITDNNLGTDIIYAENQEENYMKLENEMQTLINVSSGDSQ